MSYPLTIVTPAGKFYEDIVDSLYASGLQGGFEIYTNHQATVTALKDGVVRVRKDGKESVFNCGSGILEVTPDHQVLVLVDSTTTS